MFSNRILRDKTMETKKNIDSDFCVCCGEPVGEGSVVCCTCETGSSMTAHGKRAKHTKDAERKQIPVMKLRIFVRELYCINHKIKCTKGAE